MPKVILPHQLPTWPAVKNSILRSKSNPSSCIQQMMQKASRDGHRLLTESLLVFICNAALEIETLFAHHTLVYLSDSTNDEIRLNQREIPILMAHAFLDTFPENKNVSTGHRLSFQKLFDHRDQRRPEMREKLNCILLYFTKCMRNIVENNTWVGSLVSICRKYIKVASSCEDWMSSDQDLSLLCIDKDGLIEETPNSLQADFANKYIGGGVLNHGCVQEEIRFIVSPECLVSILFCEVMNPLESILIRGTQRFTNYTGYSRGFKCTGERVDTTPINAEGFRDNMIVAYDATKYQPRSTTQYTRQQILRDLNKVQPHPLLMRKHALSNVKFCFVMIPSC